MKLGGYGCLRVATFLMPAAAHEYSPIIVALSCIAILYGAFATMMQTDLKYINAYSSVKATVALCCWVLACLPRLRLTDSAADGFSRFNDRPFLRRDRHDLKGAYERSYQVWRIADFISTVFVIAGLCSLGLPGLEWFCRRDDGVYGFMGKMPTVITVLPRFFPAHRS